MFATVVRRPLTVGFIAFFAVLMSATSLTAQQGRTALDARLDSLATERAQELSEARADYERAVEDLRARAEREENPDLYTEGQPALENQREIRRLMIELDYQTRRADILAAHIGRRPAADVARQETVDVKEAPVAPIASDAAEMSRLNDELARAWAEFHERAEALRERGRRLDRV